jgi:ABC-2 type transport system ATP-binding protein
MQNVTKRFPHTAVLDGLNFTVSAGKVVGLLGRNGAGKTTLIECALGLREIDKGEIRLLGDTPMALSETARGRIGYVPQHNDLFEWLTAPQLLAFFKAFYPRWNGAKVSALLDRWSIPLGTPIGKLSGGEKQRLAIIRALAHDPDVLVLDEPVASLDPAGRRDFLRELVERTIESETTVLFSTHILSDLERVAVEVAFMRNGNIVLQEQLDSLAEQTHRLKGPSALLRGPFPAEHARTNDASGNTSVLVRNVINSAVDAKAWLDRGVLVERVSLEDFFIEVTQ